MQILALAAFGSVYRALEEGLGTLGSPLSETMFVRIARVSRLKPEHVTYAD